MVDASAAIDYLLGTPAGRLCDPWFTSDDVALYTPEICDVEVVGALRRLILGRRLDARRGEIALQRHLGLPLTRLPHEGLARRALGLRDNFTAADAFYVVLANALGARLLTTDGRLARATRRRTRVEVVPV